jgi:hypothetical protein
VGPSAIVMVFKIQSPLEAEATLERALLDMDVRCLVATREGLLCAVAHAGERDPEEVAAAAREALARSYEEEVRVAISRPASVAMLRRSYHEARYALESLLGVEAVVHRGHEGVREAFQAYSDTMASCRYEFSEFRDLGDRAVAIGR